MPADQQALEHVHGCLTAALGAGWPQAMRLDPVAITSDCVVETYGAVLLPWLSCMLWISSQTGKIGLLQALAAGLSAAAAAPLLSITL